ncbi:MAG: YraN family protein [Epsilonproteobacteria bacterium]|nr:YraN family protein [Campylobacterota bacterium]
MSRQKGNFAEDQAISYLQNYNFLVIDRNYSSRFGEIDIIATKERVLHFIEVKSGQYDPIYQITPTKLSKIQKTAQIYMSTKKLDMDFCFDALIITEEIEFIENITQG